MRNISPVTLGRGEQPNERRSVQNPDVAGSAKRFANGATSPRSNTRMEAEEKKSRALLHDEL